jgi:hypothetical protein
MFSSLRPELVYTDVSPDICEHDEDMDAEEWSYEGRLVYKGALDVSYRKHNLDVYWLYDEVPNRVGLAEHDSDDHSIFRTLWFRDNMFSTLLQEDWETKNKTIWSLMTPEAYQDFSSLSPIDLAIASNGKIIIPEFLINGVPDVYECSTCNRTSLLPITCRDAVKKKLPVNSQSFFIDESFIIYKPSADSAVFSWLSGDVHLPLRRCEREQLKMECPPEHHESLPEFLPQQEQGSLLQQTELQQLHEMEETPEQT